MVKFRNYVCAIGLTATLGGIGNYVYHEINMPSRIQYKNDPILNIEFKNRFEKQNVGLFVSLIGAGLMYASRKRNDDSS